MANPGLLSPQSTCLTSILYSSCNVDSSLTPVSLGSWGICALLSSAPVLVLLGPLFYLEESMVWWLENRVSGGCSHTLSNSFGMESRWMRPYQDWLFKHVYRGGTNCPEQREQKVSKMHIVYLFCLRLFSSTKVTALNKRNKILCLHVVCILVRKMNSSKLSQVS